MHSIASLITFLPHHVHRDNGHDTNTGGVLNESRTRVCCFSPGPSSDPRHICLDNTLKCATILPESSFIIISFILQRSSISHSFARSAVSNVALYRTSYSDYSSLSNIAENVGKKYTSESNMCILHCNHYAINGLKIFTSPTFRPLTVAQNKSHPSCE